MIPPRFFCALLSVGVLLRLLDSNSAHASVFFRPGDPGPVVSNVLKIVPYASGVLAFEETGAFLLGTAGWEPFLPTAGDARLTYLPGAGEVFVSGGNLYGLTASGGRSLLSRLSPSRVWQVLAEVDGPAGSPLESASESRFYAFSGGRFVSVSLEDGSERPEPPWPAPGRFFVVSGRPMLVAASSAPGKPVYRLDTSGWSRLGDWTAHAEFLFSGGGTIWSLESGVEVRRLSPDGSSRSVKGVFPSAARGDPACSSCRDLAFLEWRAEILLRDPTSGFLNRLVGDAFVPFEPAPPNLRVARLDPVGDRLFAFGTDRSLYVFDGTTWLEIPAPGGRPGADRSSDFQYFQGERTLYAGGNGVWRRDPGGWTKLPSPPGLRVGSYGELYGQTPVVQVALDSAARLLAYSRDSGRWVDLDLPRSVAPVDPRQKTLVFGVNGDLYAASPSGSIARLRDGTWRTLQPALSCSVQKIVETSGNVFVLCFLEAFRVDGDSLVPAFPELEGRFRVADVLAVGGVTYLAGSGLDFTDREAAKPVLLARSGGVVTPILDERDDVDLGTLASVGSELVVGRGFPGRYLVVGRGGLREARADGRVVAAVDRAGRFASASNEAYGISLLVPSVRVRKSLPACVDTVGFGGARYRSSLLLANISDTPLTAKIEAGGSVASFIALGPREERWVEDPCPAFVGPLGVTFEGASNDGDAFALVRVHSPSEGGTAGTSLVGVDSGSFTGMGVLLSPVAAPGDRLHLALANAGDGRRKPFDVSARPPESGVPEWSVRNLVPGRLVQTDSLPPATGATRIAGYSNGGDDLLGYVVRNDGRTNDGAVVPFEPADPLPWRRTRFLPAVVSLASPFARYRTELSMARRRYFLVDDEQRTRTYRVRYRSSASSSSPVSGTFDVGLRLGDVLRVDDVGAWLVAKGVPVEPGAVDGTLTFTCNEDVGAADLVVTAIVLGSARIGGGEYGVTVPLVNEGRWAGSAVVVPGLLENEQLRSNVAVANPEPEGGPDVSLTVSIHSGFDGERVGTLPSVTLRPGERFQFHRPLREIGYGDGTAYAVVERTGGSGRFVAYGVLNDAVTSDGTYLPMAPVPVSSTR